MKIRTKLIAALLSFVAVASLPCIAAYSASTSTYDCKTVSAQFNKTYECILYDKDKVGVYNLADIQCTVSKSSFLWYTSCSQVVKASSCSKRDTVTIKVYSSFVNSNGKVVLWDLTSESVGKTTECVSKVSTSSSVKSGNVLIYCTEYNSEKVSTYVKYSYK